MIKDLGQVAAIYIGTTEPVNYTLLWLDTNKNPGVYKAYDSNLKQWVPLATQSWVQNLINTWIQNWPVSDDLTEGDYILINKGGENYKIEAQDVIQNLIGKPLNFQNIVSNGSQLPASASDLKNGDLYILNVPGDIDTQVVTQPTQQVFPNRSILFWDEGEWKSMGRVEWKCDLSMVQTSDTVTVNSSLGTGITIPTATDAQAGVLSAILFTYLTKLSNGTIIPRTPNGSTQTPGHIHNYTDIEGRIIVIDAVGDINKDLDTSNPPSQRAVTAALNTKYDKTGGEISGIVRITDGTEATQLGEGSLITNGGLSVFKNVFFGENLDVVGATYLHSTLDVDGITHILNTTNSTANNNGALVVDGGVGIAKNVNIGGAVDIDGNSSLHGTLTVDGATTLNSTLHTVGAVTFDSTLDVAGISNFNNTTDSTAYTNGAVVVDGGVGIAKRLNVHGAVDFDSTLNTDGAVTFNNTLDVDGATTLNSTLDVDGASVLHSTLKVEGITSITNTTASTDYNNGALVVTGGVGIQGALNTHGAVDFDSTLNVDGVTTISNTTDSTSTSTGALVVKGGVGIAKQLRVGGATNLGSTLSVTGATTLNNTLHGVGAVTFDSTLNTVGVATFGSTVNITGVLNANNTTESTAYTNGGAVFDGGVGIAKRLNVHGAVDFDSTLIVGGATTLSSTLTVAGITNVTNITDSTSTATGAIHTAGGVGIAKQLRVGGNTTLGSNLSVGGNSTLTGSLTVNGATEVQDITIHGNVTQEGQSFITEAETVEIKDNILLINKGEVGAGVTAGLAGIEVDRGTSPNFQFVFDESDDYFKAGEIGDLQILLLRDADANLTNNKFFYWDNTNKIAKTREMLISDINDLNSTWDAFMKNGLYTRDILINSNAWTVLSTVDGDTTRIYAPTTMSTNSDQVLTGSSDSIPKWGYPNVVSVHDIRGTAPTPDEYTNSVAQFFFTNMELPDGISTWVSKLSVKGWNAGYNVWELAGYGGQGSADVLSFRSGSGDNWNNWHRIAFQDWTTTQLGNYLPLTGGTLTGALRFVGSALPEATTTDFFLCMDAFNAGGRVKYINASNVLAAIGGVSSSSLNNYLPLTAGSTKPLTGPLYINGVITDGINGYGLGLIVGNGTSTRGIEIRSSGCTLGFGSHQDGIIRFWRDTDNDSTFKGYFAEVDAANGGFHHNTDTYISSGYNFQVVDGSIYIGQEGVNSYNSLIINRANNKIELTSSSDALQLISTIGDSSSRISITPAGAFTFNNNTVYHAGNLGTITFTGAVSATYNGQSNITVNIPEGGGGGGLADIDISNGAAVSGQYVSGASASNGIITFMRASLPTLSGGASATSGQYVSGVTVSGHTVTVTKANLPTVTLNSLGITATAAEINKLDGLTATTTELNYVDGVTSNIQTQLNNKAASTHTHTVSQISNLGTNWSARLTAAINVKSVNINGAATSYLNTTNATAVTIYAPTSAGTDGYLLVSNGSGAPSWASVSSVVGTGFVTLDTAQTITGAKTFTAYTIFSNGAGTATSSDKRLKENIKEITYNKGFDEISLYSYNFKGRKEEKIGLIAQEVQKVIPQAVVKDEKGYLAIDTYPIVATLVAANKERVKEVKDLKSEIDNLKQEIETLKQEISILKRIVRL